MDVLFKTLVATYLISLIARKVETKTKRPAAFFTIITITILVLVAGLRWGIGDTPAYVHLYDLVGPGYSANGAYEPGFVFFFKVLKSISSDPQFMIFMTALITNVFNIWNLRKYCEDNYFELAVFMYIASGYYLVTMNGIRQSLAASVLFATVPLIKRGELKKFLLVVGLMTTVHNSSLIMIPIYFIARTKAWEKTTIRLLGLTVVGVLFFQPLMDIVFKLLGDSKYGDYAEFDEGGANLIRIAVFLVPVILSYIKRKEIKKWDNGDIFVNISIMCAIIMIFSAFNWIFARFTVTLQMYTFVALPYIVKHGFKDSERRLVYFGLVVCYLIFFYYEHGIALNIAYTTHFKFENLFYEGANWFIR